MAHARAVAPADPQRALLPVLGIAVGVFAFHVALSGRYGFHRDELYHLAAGQHPALGYVDGPPLVPLLARAVTEVAGAHLWPLRALAGAAHAVVVVLAALMARDLGGRRWATTLAALAVATMPLFVVSGSRFQPAVFGQLWWSLAVLLVVRLLAGADPRWWLAVGAVVGLGLETSWTVTLLVIGLAAGLVAVPEARPHLRTPWLWAGAAVVVGLWLPNLVWQALTDWPTLEFARNDRRSARADEGWIGFVLLQVGFVGPVGVPLVGAGFVWLGRSRPWRVLAVATATVGLVLVAIGGRASGLGPVYVLGAGAGAVAVEGWLAADRRHWRRAVGALVVNGLVPLAALAPVAPVEVYAGAFLELNDDLAEEVGWPEMVDIVAAVVDVLPADEQIGVRVVTRANGEAAAIDLYGPARGLPPGTALSGHNGYADWWPDGEPAATFLVVGYTVSALEPYCDAVGPVAVVEDVAGLANGVAGAAVLVCRGLHVPPDEFRDALRRLE